MGLPMLILSFVLDLIQKWGAVVLYMFRSELLCQLEGRSTIVMKTIIDRRIKRLGN